MSNWATMPSSTERGLRAGDPIPDGPLPKASTTTKNTPKNVTSTLSMRRRPKGLPHLGLSRVDTDLQPECQTPNPHKYPQGPRRF